MKYLTFDNLKSVAKHLRRYISPVYIMMFVAAFVLWYITKLGDTYTMEHQVTVVVDGSAIEVDCTIRGKGTDLIGYTVSSRRSRFEISPSELSFDYEGCNSNKEEVRHISNLSLRQALAARMSDIEVIAVGSIPPIIVSEAEY